jgi:hypothetical protein
MCYKKNLSKNPLYEKVKMPKEGPFIVESFVTIGSIDYAYTLPMHPQRMYMPQQSMINNHMCNRSGSTILYSPNHEHTNNDNGIDNGPRDHHFKTMCLIHINKHMNFIGWHFHSSYKSCSQSHNRIMTSDPWVNLKLLINAFSFLKL